MKQTVVPLAKKGIALILACALVASLLCIGGSFTLPFAHATETGDTQDTQVQGTTTDGTDGGGANSTGGEGTTGQNNTTTPGTDGGDATPPISGEGEGSSSTGTAGGESTVSGDGTVSTAGTDPEPTAEELSELFILAGDDNITTLEASTGGSSLIGRGTSEDPLQIHTGQQLKDFAECFNAGTLPTGVSATAPHLVLMNDIDISSFANWEPIGTYKDNENRVPFKGTFKSAGSACYAVKGLSIDAVIDASSLNTTFGLFGYTQGATLERIRVEATQVSVTASSTELILYAGVLVGCAEGSTITSCSTSGAVKVAGGKNAYAGGLAGSANSILKSYATGSVESIGSIDSNYVGGLVGFGSEISTSYATGSAAASGGSARNYAGGLAGSADSILNSYATGSLSATEGNAENYAGGLAGELISVIDNSIALGREVTALDSSDARAGSAVGSAWSEEISAYAWSGMSVTGGGGDDGQAASYDMLTGTNGVSNLWETLGFNTGFWTYDSQREQDPYALPILSEVANAVVQNDNLPFWIQRAADDPEQPADYRIYTAEDLAAFRDLVNAGNTFEGKTVSLMNDIDISCYPNWEPIGTDNATPFKGTFTSYFEDPMIRATYTISGLSIDKTVTVASASVFAGLFGWLDVGAKLEYINIESATIRVIATASSVHAFAGILAGRIGFDANTTDHCSASGDIYIKDVWYTRAGGLVGACNPDVSNSHANVDIVVVASTGQSHIGGLIGYGHKDIRDSYAVGTLTDTSIGNTSMAGGLAGIISKISNSYAYGSVSVSGAGARNYAGGLAGQAATIENSVALGQKSSASNATTTNLTGSVAGTGVSSLTASYAWDGMTLGGSGGINGTPATYSMLTGTGGEASLWTTLPLNFGAAPWVYGNDEREQDPYAIPILTGMLDGTQSENLPFWIRDTTTNNYYISTAQELAAFRDMVNAGNTFEGKTVYLMNDIDISCYPNWEPIGTLTDWEALADTTKNKPFNGIFTSFGTDDTGAQNTFTIRGLSLKAEVNGTAKTSSTGLFGYVGGRISDEYIPTIEHVRVEATQVNVDDKTSEYLLVGVLIGYSDGLIDNCSASGAVAAKGTGSVYAGGLAGIASNISNSCATGSATALQEGSTGFFPGIYAGGLAGSAFNILHSYATGSVSATSKNTPINAGGLVGSSTTIKNSYAIGFVSISGGSFSVAGGLAGYNSGYVYNSYATGFVMSSSREQSIAGGLVGLTNNTIVNSFATGSVVTSGENINWAGGLVGRASSNLPRSIVIDNCVALNQKVTTTGGSNTRAGRIVGMLDDSLSNNYAWSGMIVNADVIADNDENAQHDKVHGAHISSSNALNAAWWALEVAPADPSGPDFDFTETGAWEAADGYLPLLKNPKATPYRPLWLITFPEENCTLELATEDETTFLKKDGATGTVDITAAGTYLNAAPNALVWTCEEDPAGEAVTFLDSTSTGATVEIDLSSVGAYTIKATLQGWSEISKTLTIYVNGDLGSIGKATLSGNGVFGSTLTASFDIIDTSKPAPQEPSYAWYADGALIPGAVTETLSLTDENLIGKSIQARISASNYNNYAESTGITVAKTPYLGEVLDPQLAEVSASSLTLVECTEYEYQLLPAGTPATDLLDTGWQDSPHFTQLDSNESYDVYQRVKEADTVAASDPKGPLNVRTPLEFTWHSGLSSYTKQSNASFGLTINHDLNLLDTVLVDGQAVTDIKTASGSTIITFGNTYLDGLSTGNHTLKVTYTDGAFIDTSFEVKAASAPTPSPHNPGGGTTPKTGDTILPILALVGALVVVAVGIFVARRIITKRGKKQ